MRRSVVALAALLALLAATLAGCSFLRGPEGQGPAGGSASPADEPVVVASFNFTESLLLGEIYAQALERAGVPVRRELDLGPRELVQPALAQGLVDVVPEYLGTALLSVRPAPAIDLGDAVAVRQALGDAVAPWHVAVLQPSAAQDRNGVVVTRATADVLGLRSVSDLAGHDRSLVLGGPAECPSRPFCLLGLQGLYGLQFAGFVPLASQAQEQTALDQGVVDVAVMFTTDGHLADPDLVVLDDDRRLQPAENVVPLASSRALERYGDRLSTALDGVSGQLTSSALTFLNWRVDLAGKDVATEARGWLARHPPP